MVLNSTGSIKFSDLQTEFGGTPPISFSEYYSDAPTGFTTGVSGIPIIANGRIKISDFRGKGKNFGSLGGSGRLTVNLSSLNLWHNNNAASFKSFIPSFQDYTYANNTGTSLSYNFGLFGGNRTVLSGIQGLNSTLVAYGSNVSGQDNGYLLTSGTTVPQTTIMWNDSGLQTLTIQDESNLPKASNSITNPSGTYTTNNNRGGNFYGTIYNFTGGNASIGQIWFTATSSAWNSSITSVVDGRGFVNIINSPFITTQFIRVTGENFILGKILIMTNSGSISTTNISDFVTNYVQNIS
jgi:hypothetical protein